MAEDTRKNILEVDVVQSIDKTDTVLVNDSGSLKQVSVETLVSSGIPDQYVTESELTEKGYATTTAMNSAVGAKLDKNQGSSNSGKYLSVGSDGNVTLVDAPTSGGGSEEAENGLPSGGTAGQYLRKKSATDYDTEWTDVPDEITVKTMQNTDTAVTLPEETPYDLYIFPEMATLAVTIANENTDVHFFFDSGTTATVFSLQAQDGGRIYTDAYSIDANMRYEVSVLHNVAYIEGVSTSAET